MLRPFLSDVPRDIFPGCFPGKSFQLTQEFHGSLLKNMTAFFPIPALNAGDSVWWHPDLIHRVITPTDADDEGRHRQTVLYVPAGPDCPRNRDYSRKARHCMIRGSTPPDFPPNDLESGFKNRADLRHLTHEGRKSLGFERIEDEEEGKCG